MLTDQHVSSVVHIAKRSPNPSGGAHMTRPPLPPSPPPFPLLICIPSQLQYGPVWAPDLPPVLPPRHSGAGQRPTVHNPAAGGWGGGLGGAGAGEQQQWRWQWQHRHQWHVLHCAQTRRPTQAGAAAAAAGGGECGSSTAKRAAASTIAATSRSCTGICTSTSTSSSTSTSTSTCTTCHSAGPFPSPSQPPRSTAGAAEAAAAGFLLPVPGGAGRGGAPGHRQAATAEQRASGGGAAGKHRGQVRGEGPSQLIRDGGGQIRDSPLFTECARAKFATHLTQGQH